MNLFDRRRGLIGMSGASSSELYAVGTGVVTKYIGRDANGKGLFEHGKFDNKTGEINITGVSSDSGTSTIYIPVNPLYSYQKSSAGRLIFCGFYDENYNYISYISQNNLNVVDLPAFPDNARYIRIATLYLNNNWGIEITRTA